MTYQKGTYNDTRTHHGPIRRQAPASGPRTTVGVQLFLPDAKRLYGHYKALGYHVRIEGSNSVPYSVSIATYDKDQP